MMKRSCHLQRNVDVVLHEDFREQTEAGKDGLPLLNGRQAALYVHLQEKEAPYQLASIK